MLIMEGKYINKTPEPNSRIKATIIAIFSLIIGIQIFSSIWWTLFADENSVVLNHEAVGTGILFFAGLGAFIALVIYKIYPQWTDDDSKKVGYFALAGTLATKICTSGACIPAAFISTILTIPILMLTLFGALGAKLYRNFCTKSILEKN